MIEQLALLRCLQDLDDAIRKRRNEQAALHAEVDGEEETIAEQMESLRRRQEEAKELRLTLDRKELKLKRNEETVNRLKVQLNTIKTNREYTTLQREIGGLNADTSLLEDEMLGMLEKADQDDAEWARLHKELEEAHRRAEAQRKEAQARTDVLDREIAACKQQREDILPRVMAEVLQPYQRLLGKQDGKAVVPAQETAPGQYSCAGCHIQLTANTVNHLMAPHELVFCHSCGRILYLDETADE